MGAIIALIIFIFITGLCIGSFLNVVILRSLSNESIVFPASKCPKCQKPLKWWHNIPVISYIALGGKCDFCGERISIQYPIVELLTGILFTLLFMKFGLSINVLFTWIITALLIVIAGTDLKEKVVFDIHTYILAGVGFLYAITALAIAIFEMHKAGTPFEMTKYFLLNNPLTLSILGVIAGIVILEICARAGYLIVGTRAFGEGDTFIAAGLGAVFGWKALLAILGLSVLIQVIVFMPIFIRGLVQHKDWKTLITFFGFVIFAIAFYILQYFRLITADTIVMYVTLALILAILGIVSCVLIFKGLREHPETRTYMPFGPAMVAAAFIALLL